MEFNLNGGRPGLRPVNGDSSGSNFSVTEEVNGAGKCDKMQ
jgi:hypothetical protein